jgi:hypothetical protein
MSIHRAISRSPSQDSLEELSDVKLAELEKSTDPNLQRFLTALREKAPLPSETKTLGIDYPATFDQTQQRTRETPLSEFSNATSAAWKKNMVRELGVSKEDVEAIILTSCRPDR